ncbi:50S ribosomal protein L6 [Isachenkonia alkalipeptolytica]|uniref:Large ribosomal subunit protein uL6 n=1 Tax=Isachenkonia alkalipeptolytica TaxID=2565777 RepID=A0AA43XN66_9CLOT|nr:50S ribosomal protein L6 [Isachenkonia alkalipeptolytica]NBG89000.1 50S ribosomal protein L6 [Isachenkonia alkalipeptolytica]
MSRIGIRPIEIKEGIDITIDNKNVVTVKGPKGTLSEAIPQDIKITREDNSIVVTRPTETKKHKSLHGLSRTLINNMVEGVTNGFEKKLELNGVGYRANLQGKKLVLSLGYSHPVEMEQPEGIEVEVPSQTQITVKGANKQQVGNFAAKVRELRKPEPYKGKGIKYVDEHIRRKEGKTAK